jgi:uncharacterized protein YacL
MLNYIYEIISAILASFVAIYGLNYLYEIFPHLRQELGSYRNKIIYTPSLFIIVTLLIAKILDSLIDEDAKIRNYFSYIKGIFIGIIMAYFGSKYWKLNKIVKIDNPIMYYIYCVIVSIILYGFVIEYIKKNI